jgi:murein DD-endopeptidase MepM/ murein hydrolase activator NlpD
VTASKNIFRALLLGACIPPSLFLANTLRTRMHMEQQLAEEAKLARQQAAVLSAQFIQFTERAVPRGLNVTDYLTGLGLARATVLRIVEAARPVYDLSRVRAGNRFAIGHALDGSPRAVRYQIDADNMLHVAARGDDYLAEIRAVPSSSQTVRLSGKIHDALFNAVADIGETPELAVRLAEIFAWDLDFYTDPRRGDTFSLVVDKKTYMNGQPPSYGKIRAAEYLNGGRSYQALLFRDPQGREAYYAPDGKSLQKAFLRSPLKFAAPVTSRFSRSRFHPVLKTHRPHLGTDYGAPAGTPVQAIGEGRVVFAGRKGDAGNMVHLKHANGFETQYLHLSRILVRTGERVAQGERIGLVGATGLATGPHLDFRVRQNGQYRNFESLRLPPAEPVARKDWQEFVALRGQWLPALAGNSAALARLNSAPQPSLPAPAFTAR